MYSAMASLPITTQAHERINRKDLQIKNAPYIVLHLAVLRATLVVGMLAQHLRGRRCGITVAHKLVLQLGGMIGKRIYFLLPTLA